MDSHSSHIVDSSFNGTSNSRDLLASPAASSFCHNVSQAQILDFLGQASSYGQQDPVDRVDMIQSVLFMAGSFCFKLRRETPLGQTGNLSLEQRYRLACQEIRLGKNFAPDLYLDLVPIRHSGTGLMLQLSKEVIGETAHTQSLPDKDAPIVDWLVMLRRYDFSKSYDKQVEVYQPNFSDCRKLAALVPSHYETDEGAKQARSWINHLDEMLEGFSSTVRKIDKESRQPTLRSCYNRAEMLMEVARPLIEKRGKRGLIGPIHGNAGLSNVVEVSGRLRLVNPQVSRNSIQVREWVGDPLYDLASLVGELWSRGLNRQANWVLSHYCNQLLNSHALNGLALLDLYLFIRASDRIRQIANKLSDTEEQKRLVDIGGNRGRALQGYLKTARDSLVQDEAMLLVIGGSCQANRSHLARLLAPAIGRMPGALYLSAHQEMLALYEVDSAEHLPLSAHRQSVWRLVYRRLADKARQALKAGYSVLLEGRFDSPASRRNLTALAEESDVPVPVLAFHLFAPRTESKQGSSDLEQKADHLACSAADFPPSPGNKYPILGNDRADQDWTTWIELDTSRSVGELLGQALGQINPAWTPISTDMLH